MDRPSEMEFSAINIDPADDENMQSTNLFGRGEVSYPGTSLSWLSTAVVLTHLIVAK